MTNQTSVNCKSLTCSDKIDAILSFLGDFFPGDYSKGVFSPDPYPNSSLDGEDSELSQSYWKLTNDIFDHYYTVYKYREDDNRNSVLYEDLEVFHSTLSSAEKHEQTDKFIQFVHEYIKRNFHKSKIVKVQKMLNILGIDCLSFDADELGSCLDKLKKKLEELDSYYSPKLYIADLLTSLDEWNTMFQSESLDSVWSSEPYEKLATLFYGVSSIFESILRHDESSQEVKELEEKIVELNAEIKRIRIESKKEENRWWLQSTCSPSLASDFLPHNYAEAFVIEFITPNTPYAKEVETGKYDEELFFGDKNKDVFAELGVYKYETITIRQFIRDLIESIEGLIKIFKFNENYNMAKEFSESNEFGSMSDLYNSLLNTLIDSMSKSLNEPLRNRLK